VLDAAFLELARDALHAGHRLGGEHEIGLELGHNVDVDVEVRAQRGHLAHAGGPVAELVATDERVEAVEEGEDLRVRWGERGDAHAISTREGASLDALINARYH
jgi:hypothetical protein